jgi:hypothetical protein
MPIQSQKNSLVKILEENKIIENGILKKYNDQKLTNHMEIINCMSFLSSTDNLQFLKAYDKNAILPDSILYDSFFNDLNLKNIFQYSENGVKPEEFLNMYFEALPSTDVENFSRLIPVYNKYFTSQINEGIKVNENGSVTFISEGNKKWTSYLLKSNHQKQEITIYGQTDAIKILVQNIVYKERKDTMYVEEMLGVGLIKK